MTVNKSNFFGILLHALTYYRLYHWNIAGIGSKSQHQDIDLFHEKLSSLLDKLVETTQAHEGILDIEVPKATILKTPLEYSQALFYSIEKYYSMFELSFQKSILDEIQSELSLLIYKLKFLK